MMYVAVGCFPFSYFAMSLIISHCRFSDIHYFWRIQLKGCSNFSVS
jgi:hypothetical protein